jgi:hypothetical protein
MARLFYVGIGIDRSSEMDKPRPYVTAALLCERVLHEKDESVTLVRIVDRIQYRVETKGEGIPKDIKPIVSIQGLVSLKSGPVTGDHVITIWVEKPNGERKQAFAFPVKFLGGDQGQNLLLNIGLGIDQDGLYWFDVFFDAEVLTRTPVMITPLPEPEPKAQT